MQNGSRKMTDTRYTSIYTKKTQSNKWPQLSAETCRELPADRKAESAKPAKVKVGGKL
jgi:hypothetical protein